MIYGHVIEEMKESWLETSWNEEIRRRCGAIQTFVNFLSNFHPN
jgi:hypothetical protein